jgi:hypothetical protein
MKIQSESYERNWRSVVWSLGEGFIFYFFIVYYINISNVKMRHDLNMQSEENRPINSTLHVSLLCSLVSVFFRLVSCFFYIFLL